jgi:hypothetical protein
MNKIDLFIQHQRRIVNMSISTSAFRSQGKPLTIKSTRELLYKLDLNNFKKSLENETYIDYLDAQTAFLLEKLADKYQVKWGTIRKGLNLFFRDVFYSAFMNRELGLKDSYFGQLEVPLDSYTGIGILEDANKIAPTKLKWTTIKELTPEKSKQIQDFAKVVANKIYQLDCAADLDLIYWKREQAA